MTNEDTILTDLKSVKTELAEVKSELVEVRDELRKLSTCIVGDKINNRPGIMDFLQTHKNDLYGDKDTLHVGLKEMMGKAEKRLKSLEDDRKKIYWMSAGISGSVLGVWALAKAWFTHKGP